MKAKPWQFAAKAFAALALVTIAEGAQPQPGVAFQVIAEPDSIALQRESVNRQKESVSRQAAAFHSAVSKNPSASKVFIVPLFEPVTIDCGPVRARLLENLISTAAKQNQLSPAVLRAIIRQESGFNPCAVSYRGAQGLMQLMPETAYELGVADPFDPRQNIEGGAYYLKQLLDKYGGDLKLALSAYNAGPARVDLQGGIPQLPETENYVAAVCTILDGGNTEPQALRCAPPLQTISRIK
jgi:soluble lytic murein transglycosylase-like protein